MLGNGRMSGHSELWCRALWTFKKTYQEKNKKEEEKEVQINGFRKCTNEVKLVNIPLENVIG